MSELLFNNRPIEIIGDNNYLRYLNRAAPDGASLYGLAMPGPDDIMCQLRVVPQEASGLAVYDEKELGERLEDMWAAEATIMHRTYHVSSLHQNRGTCWIHGTCQAMGMLQIMANIPYRPLSPASVACHCYSNFGVNGGYPAKGVSVLQEKGACPISLWPENGFSRKYDTPESQASREFNWLEEVVIFSGGAEERLMRCLSAHVQGKPTGQSFDWWSHYVCGCWGRYKNGRLMNGIRNTWGDDGFGDKGFGLLEGSRMYPSWACAFLRVRQTPPKLVT